MNRDSAFQRMTQYFQDARLIEHTTKVLHEGEALLETDPEAGGFVTQVVYLSCVFHDIGIPTARRKHGSAAGPYQEREGATVSGTLLQELDVRPDILERVCYIVGHHHTQSSIDGPDFRIVWDADMLVNLAEGNVVPKVPKSQFLESNFQTAAGRRRAGDVEPPGGWPASVQ